MDIKCKKYFRNVKYCFWVSIIRVKQGFTWYIRFQGDREDGEDDVKNKINKL